MPKVIPFQNGKIRLMGGGDRLTMVGKTGSGKSYAAMWHLANQPLASKTWIIVNPKRTKMYYEIDAIEEMEIDEKIPRHGGLYMVCPVPGDDLDKFFFNVWEKENTGLLLDEAGMCGFGRGFMAVLTQGREKKIPMISLTQRPVRVHRYVFSEAQFFQVFWMTDQRDKTTIREFFPSMPENFRGERLPKFWSWYYDYDNELTYALHPVPDIEESVGRIDDKLKRRQIVRRL
jgi:hypothetical protein